MVSHVSCRALRAGLIPLVIATLAPPAFAADVVEVEEHWSLTVGGPEAACSAPQISMVMSGDGGTDGDYFLVSLNHWSLPDFAPGGVQTQHWRGDDCVSVAQSTEVQPLQIDGETLAWVQRLTLADGRLDFQVCDGVSSSWGAFTAANDLRLSTPTDLVRLNDYKPAVSLTESGIGFAGNRVSSLVLQKVRWRFAGEDQWHEMVAPIDIDSDLDP